MAFEHGQCAALQEDTALKPNPLSVLHMHRRILGLIGVLHCPTTPDFARAYAHFEHMCRQAVENHLCCIAAQRCIEPQIQMQLQHVCLRQGPVCSSSHWRRQHLEVLHASTSCCSVLCGCSSAFRNVEVRSLCRAFPEAFVLRCFAFEPSDAQVEVDTSAREHLIMFPPARSGQRCSRPQERCPCP